MSTVKQTKQKKSPYKKIGKQESGSAPKRFLTTGIINDAGYRSALDELNKIMKKGEDKLTRAESTQMDRLVSAISNYEKKTISFPEVESVNGLLELVLLESKLKQLELANLLEVSEDKLSRIMNKKTKPDIQLLQFLNQKLGIDGNLLLRLKF